MATTAECSYIGGHTEGFDPECWWCHRATLGDRTRAALEGITPGPWEHRTAPSDDSEQSHAQWLVDTLVGGDELHVLIAESPEPRYAYIVPAVTGDGPTSERNAKFISAARTLVPELLGEVERQEQLITEFRRRDESATATIARLRAENDQLRSAKADRALATMRWNGTRPAIESICRWANASVPLGEDPFVTYEFMGADDVQRVLVATDDGDFTELRPWDSLIKTADGFKVERAKPCTCLPHPNSGPEPCTCGQAK